VPEEHELPDRLPPVLAVVYLVYNAGLTSATNPDLCSEAIRLARILATLMPDEAEVAGLLALLLLTDSRRASRTRPDGSLVLLGEQDRRRWDRALIEEGQAIVRQCLRRNQPGAYQLQAAINAVHADATTHEQTDWSQIVALYDQLLAVAATPVVALNRAIAIGEVRGASAALALVDELDLDNYHPFHATRADLLRRLGRNGEAAAAYERAAALAPPTPSGTSSSKVAEPRAERTRRRTSKSVSAGRGDGAFMEPRGCNRWQPAANRPKAETAKTSEIHCHQLRPVACDVPW
jgi:RNA polymerase sigma-70 factor, ECF subfamily